ncbi:MAG: hypothetical protein ACRDKG_16280 [Actinomycetota bacterium]
MAKAAKILCDRCECKVVVGASFCGACGYPTRWATHEERTTWEVGQWKIADRSHAPKPPEKTSRRWFGRKAEPKPALSVVRSQGPTAASAAPITTPVEQPPTVVTTTEPVTAVTKAADPAPARIPAKKGSRPTPIGERVAARPKSIVRPKQSPDITPGPNDAEPLTDTPRTVMAMRLLNARVAELDAKIQRLERELDGSRQISHTP